MTDLPRREFLRNLGATAAFLAITRTAVAFGVDKEANPDAASRDTAILLRGCSTLEKALKIAAGIYPKNRVKDLLSFTNRTGYRMKLNSSPRVSICMSPDLTFGMLGSRYLSDDLYLKTFLGHLDALPRNMRRNGKFFVNEDLLAGGGRVMTQVMYPIWIWELYLALGDLDIIRRHVEPLKRCLSYIESRTDSNGVVNQVDHDDWQVSEGADWVDWCPERMEGSTCVYHSWYARALAHCVGIFRAAGEQSDARLAQHRYHQQREVLDTQFWNGESYYDNLNFAGEKVNNFWCDSQIWPIAFRYASEQKTAAIFGRIDAEPEMFEGVPLRWCAPVPKEKQETRYPEFREPHLRPYSWFGRLGAGDVLARCATGQADRALELLERYAEVVVEHGTCPECVDMQGKARFGTGGRDDYLEHAGGLLLAFGRGLLGLDDTADGTLVWRPQLPARAAQFSFPYWHGGHCWRFGFKDGDYWIDPRQGRGKVVVRLSNYEKEIEVEGKRVIVGPKPQ